MSKISHADTVAASVGLLRVLEEHAKTRAQACSTLKRYVEALGSQHAEMLATLREIAGYPHVQHAGVANIETARTLARATIAKIEKH